MKRWMISGALAAVLVSGMTGCTLKERDEYEVTVKTEVPPKMLFLGDSIAAGYGLEGYTASDVYNCPSYPNILAEEYKAELDGECGHTMVNRAVSGMTSEQLLELIRSGETDRDLRDADAVIVSIGGNDMLDIMLDVLSSCGVSESGEFDINNFSLFGAASAIYNMGGRIDTALAGFEKNLSDISAELNERSDAEIYIQTLYNPLEYYSDIQVAVDFSWEKLDMFNNMIYRHSQDPGNGYHVAEVAERFRGHNGELTNIAKFDIHPNPEGHKVIAEVVDTALRGTGFSYTKTELGEEHLTEAAYELIRLGIGGGIVLILLIILAAAVAIRKKKNRQVDK